MAPMCRGNFHYLIVNSIQKLFIRRHGSNICNGNPEFIIKHRVSQQLVNAPCKDGVSAKKSETISNIQRLMVDYGLIRHATPGTFHYLPLAIRSLNKLTRIIDKEMRNIGGMKVDMPCLMSKHLWQTTGRWDAMGEELFKLNDRHQRALCLGPTHEELVTELMSSIPNTSYRNLPILIYQIAKKYRDEIKPRFGLLRAREFLMKDLYSFDATEEDAKKTYEKVGKAYEKLLNRLGLKFFKVEADSGKIGGNISHEFHLPAGVGEDEIVLCSRCNYAANSDLHGTSSNCKSCGSQLDTSAAIEVAHSFLLGTKYSKPLKATFTAHNSAQPQFLVMGCYGVGVSRLLAAALEVLSSADQLRWPSAITPYQLCIIPPKAGSKEEAATGMAHHIYKELDNIFYDDIIYDDRTNTTIGFRLLEAKRMGYPYIVIAGKPVLETVPKFEFHDTYNNSIVHLTHSELFQTLENIQRNLLII